MIERWLQVTCDHCGEVDNSTMPDLTVREFFREISPPWRRVGRQHACSPACAKALRARRKSRE